MLAEIEKHACKNYGFPVDALKHYGSFACFAPPALWMLLNRDVALISMLAMLEYLYNKTSSKTTNAFQCEFIYRLKLRDVVSMELRDVGQELQDVPGGARGSANPTKEGLILFIDRAYHSVSRG